MWTSMLIAIVAASVCGDSLPSTPSAADSTHARCVAAALWKVPPQRTVTFVCSDGTQPKGMILGYDASRAVIQVLPDGSSLQGGPDARLAPSDARFDPREVPAANVTRLVWRERGGSVVGGAILGLLLGALAGGAVGAGAAPEENGFLDFSFLESGLVGAAIGGALGLTLGIAASASSYHSHMIDCSDGPGVVPGK